MAARKSIFEGMRGGETLHNIILLTRFYDWIDKVWLILSAGLVLLLYSSRDEGTYMIFVLFGIYQCVSIGYGYAVNAYADLKEDLASGKDRGVSHFSRAWLFLIYGSLALLMLVIPLSFLRWDVAALGLVNLFIATFYSVRPIRFKERGLWAIVMTGIPQRSFVFLFLALLLPGNEALKALLFAWLGLQGLIMEIGHQLFDYGKDREAGVRTWTVTVGPETSRRLGLVLLLLFLLACACPLLLYTLWEGLFLVFYMIFFSTHSIYYFTDAMKAA